MKTKQLKKYPIPVLMMAITFGLTIAAALSVRLPDRQRARLLRRAEAVGLVWCHLPCRYRQHELLILFL